MRDLNLRRLDTVALLGVVLSIGAAPVLAADLTARHYVIDAMAMKPVRVNFATVYAADWNGGLRNIATEPQCFTAGLNLPQGVTITRVAVAYASRSAGDPTAAVLQNSLTVSGTQSIAEGVLANDSGTRRTAELPLNQLIIDNRRYAYGFVVCLNGAENDTFYAARITYSSKLPTD